MDGLILNKAGRLASGMLGKFVTLLRCSYRAEK